MKEIDNTPFKVVEKDNEYFVTLGNHAILRCTSEQEAIDKVNTRDYELLFNLIYLANHYEKKTNENPN